MREGLLQEDKISELGKSKVSEKIKMLNEKKTEALQKKLRKKLLEDTLERQQKSIAEKLLKKVNLNIEEEANINQILENNKEMYMFNKEEEYRKTANKGGILDQDRYGMKDGGIGIEALRKEAPEVVERMGYEEGGSLLADDMPMDMSMDTPMDMPQETEMVPDEEMEENYVDFVISQTLSEEEQEFLNEQLEGNDRLSVIFDQVIEAASEFTGDGPVEGPGTGVSDDIPARLSDGEFVFTAKAVEEIGADNLEAMMKEAEAAAEDRQELNVGGQPITEEEMKVDQFGKPMDSNVADDEIRKGMLSANPRLR